MTCNTLLRATVVFCALLVSAICSAQNSDRSSAGAISSHFIAGATYYDGGGIYLGMQWNRQFGLGHSISAAPSISTRIVDVSRNKELDTLGDGSRLPFFSFGFTLLYQYGYSPGASGLHACGGVYLGNFGYFDMGGRGYGEFCESGAVDGVIGLGYSLSGLIGEVRLHIPLFDPFDTPRNHSSLAIHPTYLLLLGVEI